MIKNKNYVYEKDISIFDNIVKPKLNTNRPVSLFCSFTYITPNFYNLYIIKTLAKFAKEGYDLKILLRDINSLTHRYSRNLKREKNINFSFIDDRIQEIKNIFKFFGVDEKQLKIFKASETWRRMISINEPPIFFDLYEIMTDINLDELNFKQKASHIIQMPADTVIANYLHVLYPESEDKPVDAAFLERNKEPVYDLFRDKMLEKGLINTQRPVFFISDKLPYLIYQSKIPEWNMDIDEITYIISHYEPTVEETEQIFNSLLSDCLSEFVLVRKDKKKEVGFQELVSSLPKLDPSDRNLTLSYNLHKFLQDVRKDIDLTQKHPSSINITGKNQATEIGKVLKSKIALEILLLSNGHYNVTQIAKKLKKQISNISIYINDLKRLGLIEIMENRKVRRKINNINLNFDMGLN